MFSRFKKKSQDHNTNTNNGELLALREKVNELERLLSESIDKHQEDFLKYKAEVRELTSEIAIQREELSRYYNMHNDFPFIPPKKWEPKDVVAWIREMQYTYSRR